MIEPIPSEAYRSKWEKLLGATESPIEEALLEALCIRAISRGYRVARDPEDNDTIAIKPQKQFDKYRIDFGVIFHFHGEFLQLAIECDGQAFHSSPEQKERDSKRDRELSALGYDVLHFTGREIFRNAPLCAAEIMNRIEAFQSDRLSRSVEEHP